MQPHPRIAIIGRRVLQCLPAVAVVLSLMACCCQIPVAPKAAAPPQNAQKNTKAPSKAAPGEKAGWGAVAKTGRVGDVSIECLQVSSSRFQGRDLGEFRFYGPNLIAKLKLTNNSTKKIVRFAGWQDKAALEDEHGNNYGRIVFPIGFGGFTDFGPWGNTALLSPEDSHILAYNLSLHPGKSYTTYLFFENAAEVSKEARLTLPASELGGTGTVQLRVFIDR